MQQNTYNVGFTPGTGGNREDLLDQIINITPWETPLVATMPRKKAKHVRHDWLTDTLAATSTAGQIEGADFTTSTLTARARLFNVCQTFRKGFKVSNDQRAVDPAGVDDEYKYQALKAVREKARDLERRIWSASGTSASGSTSAARVMRSLDDFITINRFHVRSTAVGGAGGAATASATNITEGVFNGLLGRIFDQGGYPETIWVNRAGKRQISQFNGASNGVASGSIVRRNIAMADKELVLPVDVIETDFGELEIVLNRWVRQAANTSIVNTSRIGHVYALERAMVRLAVFRPFGHVPLPPSGADSTRGEVIGSYSLEVGNGRACGRMFGVNSRHPLGA